MFEIRQATAEQVPTGGQGRPRKSGPFDGQLSALQDIGWQSVDVPDGWTHAKVKTELRRSAAREGVTVVVPADPQDGTVVFSVTARRTRRTAASSAAEPNTSDEASAESSDEAPAQGVDEASAPQRKTQSGRKRKSA